MCLLLQEIWILSKAPDQTRLFVRIVVAGRMRGLRADKSGKLGV